MLCTRTNTSFRVDSPPSHLSYEFFQTQASFARALLPATVLTPACYVTCTSKRLGWLKLLLTSAMQVAPKGNTARGHPPLSARRQMVTRRPRLAPRHGN